ncbi:Lactoylglutathione lyase [Mycena kentingensis (nom. inval.)]|nr:Lactoylglutathione lyase [Mycena kentingensis (nom. inval.)]
MPLLRHALLASSRLTRPLNPVGILAARMSTDPTKYKFNHTMLRVKDPQASLKFYNFLGMSLVHTLKNPDLKFDLYFLAYDGAQSVSKKNHWTDREGVLGLTHNHGTEKNVNGNTDPSRGFGHVCVSVDNIQAACSRLADAGYRFQENLTDGRMKHIACALDPDGYRVEIMPFNPIDETQDVAETSVETYRMNRTTIRVKDIEKSLAFYEDIMGMTLVRTRENPDEKFNLYFLRYGRVPSYSEMTATPGQNPNIDEEGLLELTYNYDTELDPVQVPRWERRAAGACARWDRLGVKWKKRLTDEKMRNSAFILDPDNYCIEIVQNETLKKHADQ